MKGFEIKRENEKPIYLFNRFDVVSAIAHAIYYTANPESKMCIPNCAYERAEKEFDDWFNDTRAKKAVERITENTRYVGLPISGTKLKSYYKDGKELVDYEGKTYEVGCETCDNHDADSCCSCGLGMESYSLNTSSDALSISKE